VNASSWLTLAVGGLTAGATIIAVLITQNASKQRESVQWEREREKDRQKRAREDTLRTYEERRRCYLDFEERLTSAALAVHNRMYSSELDIDAEWQLSAFQGLLRLQVYAPSHVSERASKAYGALLEWGNGERDPAVSEVFYDEMHKKYLGAIRQDLGIDSVDGSD
jgi:hypothetical protein